MALVMVFIMLGLVWCLGNLVYGFSSFDY